MGSKRSFQFQCCRIPHVHRACTRLCFPEAIRRDGLVVAGWVANRPDARPMECEEETLTYLKGHLGAPCLGVFPWQEIPDPVALSEHLSLDVLFEN